MVIWILLILIDIVLTQLTFNFQLKSLFDHSPMFILSSNLFSDMIFVEQMMITMISDEFFSEPEFDTFLFILERWTNQKGRSL